MCLCNNEVLFCASHQIVLQYWWALLILELRNAIIDPNSKETVVFKVLQINKKLGDEDKKNLAMVFTSDIELHAVVSGWRVFEINSATIESLIGCCGSINDQVSRSGN